MRPVLRDSQIFITGKIYTLVSRAKHIQYKWYARTRVARSATSITCPVAIMFGALAAYATCVANYVFYVIVIEYSGIIFCLAKTVHQVCSCISSCIMDWLEAKSTDMSSTLWYSRSCMWCATGFCSRYFCLFAVANFQ